MALLTRKYSSATLMEAVVATVIVVILFMVASLVLNNLIKSYYLGKTHDAAYRINQLRYQMSYGKIAVPYKETYGFWTIHATKGHDSGTRFVIFEAKNEETNKNFRRSYIVYEQP